MANTSILAAFERMWQHIVTALDKKSDVSHAHEEYLVADDIANKTDKSYVDEQLETKVPVARKINNKELSADITLSASDVGALSEDTIIPSVDGLATEEYVVNKIAEAKLAESDIDLSGYYTKTETDTQIEEAVSAIVHPIDELATIVYVDEKLETKANSNHSHEEYLTQENIADKADKSELHQHSNKEELDKITSGKVENWDNKTDKTYVDAELAKKVDNAEISHSTESIAEGVTIKNGKLSIVVDSYTKSETLNKIQEKITEINGGESAGEVLGALNSYKETNDARVGAIDEAYKTADAELTEELAKKVDSTTYNADKNTFALKDDVSKKADTIYVDEELSKKADNDHVHTQYLEADDIANKADKSELHEHSNKEELDKITNGKVAAWDNKVDKSYVDEELDKRVAEVEIESSNKDTVILAEAQRGITAVQNALDIHTDDNDIHIVSSERTSWNNKADKTYVDEKLATKSDSTHTHSQYLVADDIVNKTDKSYVDEEINAAIDEAKTDAANKDAVILFEAQNSINVVEAALNAHTEKTDIHITDNERTTWNAKATTNYVDEKVAALVDSSPETLNTLNELAAALGDDPNFATTVAEQIGLKANQTDLETHTLNETVHITADERITWNNKSDFSGVYKDLDGAPNIKEDNSGELVFADNDGNIVFRSDNAGSETTTLTAKNIVIKKINADGNDISFDVETRINEISFDVETRINGIVEITNTANEAIENLNSLVGDTSVSMQIDEAISELSSNVNSQLTGFGTTLASKASTATYNGTFSADGWSSSAPYTQTITVSGLLATDNPFIDIDLSGVSDAAGALEAWRLMGRVTVSANNTLVAYCYEEKPTVAIPVILKVVR